MAIGRAYESTNGVAPGVNERDPDSLLVINTGPTLGQLTGVGGILNRLYACRGNFTLLELDPDTLLTINTASPGILPEGIGGTNTLLLTIIRDTFTFEVDPDTLLLLDAGLTHGYTVSATMGVGGMSDGQIFGCNQSGDSLSKRVTKLDSITRFRTTPDLNVGDRKGIGGTNSRLYHTINGTSNTFNELDPLTLLVINSAPSTSPDPSGAGGMKLLDDSKSRFLTTILSTPY